MLHHLRKVAINPWIIGMVFCAVLATVLSLTSCNPKSPHSGGKEGASAGSKVVNLAIWSNYVTPELLKDFETKTGIKVQVSNYSSNEELLAKLQAGASGYDVVVPSDYMVFAMAKLGLLTELNFADLPNSKQIDSRFLKKQFDPENKYSIPYDWGTTGIAVNRDLYKGEIKGWKDLFTKEDLAAKFTLLDDPREVIGAALKAQGLSLNTTAPEALKKAKKMLMDARKRVKAFTSEPKVPLQNGETPVAQAFVSDVLQAQRSSKQKIEYIFPEEGGTLWIDNLVVPQGAKNIKEAHAFINYLLEPATSVATVKAILVSPANKGTFLLLPKDLQTNPVLFPPDATVGRFEMIQDLGDALTQWDRVWTEIKAEKE